MTGSPDRSSIKKFAAMSWRRKVLIIEAGLAVLIADLAVRLLPFSMLARSLGVRHDASNPVQVVPMRAQRGVTIGGAVGAVATRMPHKPLCLAQAVAAQWLLRLHGVIGTVKLGARHTPADSTEMAAHAWVQVGDRIVVGRSGHTLYTVTACFTPKRAALKQA